MSKDVRNWRDAKLPSWIKESVAEDMENMALKAALTWPTEVKPEPLPFGWGEYDREIGKPVAGRYWTMRGSDLVEGFDLCLVEELPVDSGADLIHWKRWAFKRIVADKWSTSVIRGPLFASEHEARLYRLWLLCEEAAKTLKKARENLE